MANKKTKECCCLLLLFPAVTIQGLVPNSFLRSMGLKYQIIFGHLGGCASVTNGGGSLLFY